MNDIKVVEQNASANITSPERILLKKKAIFYLAFVYGFVFVSWILSIILPDPVNQIPYSVLFSLFSFFPLLSNILTRIITKDKSPWMVRPNFRRSWRVYLISAFVPGSLIFAGAILFFLIFPNHLDLSAEKLIEIYGSFGFPSDLPHTIESIIKIGIVGVLISPFIIPIAIYAFGEEIGWRGYLLPILMKLMSKQRAVLLNSILWGICHAPLIYFGFNYGSDYLLAPYTGILMMILVCIVLGIWLSYVTIKSNSVIPASVLHGSVNLIGEWPALVTIPSVSPLLGPNPTGIVGMIGILIGAVIILKSFSKSHNVITDYY